LPAGSVVLPTLNANGMLAIAFVCACALMASTPANTITIREMLKNLFMFFASTYSRGRLARIPSRGRNICCKLNTHAFLRRHNAASDRLGQRRSGGALKANAAGLQRAATPCGQLPAPRTRRTHTSTNGARQRGLSQANRSTKCEMAESRPFFRNLGAVDAAHTGGPRAPAPGSEARRLGA